MRVTISLLTGVRRRSVIALAACGLLSAIHLGMGAPIGAQGSGPSPQERAAFTKAQNLYAAGDIPAATGALEKFLETYPKGELRVEAATLLGHIRLEQRAYPQVISLLSEVVELGLDSEHIDRARLDLASAYLGVGNAPQAGKLLAALASSDAAPGLRREAYDLLVELAVKEHDLSRAISLLTDEGALPGDVVDRATLDARIREIIDQGQDPDQLESIAETFSGRFPGDAALVRAAQVYAAAGDLFNQERVLQTFLGAFPQHEAAAESRQTLDANRNRLRAAQFVIALPLPYQGPLQPYARSLLRGAQLAVEAARAAGGEASVMLAAKDYGGDLARLGAVLDETCRDARCVGIVGPVLSREAAVVVARAVQWRVPAVSPTATGPMPQNRYLFRTALTAQAEGTAVARYATQHLGMKRFAVITPQDRYSLDVVTAFSEEVARQGGRLIFSATYEPGAVDFGREIKRLKEVDLQQEGVLETLPSEDTAPGAPPPEPVYVPGFDAVFLPGDGETAGLVAAQLRFFDIAVPLLGSSGWNQRGVIRSGGKYVEDAIFVDAFFPQSQDPTVQQFVKQYQAKYRETPDVFAALAYDAASVLIQGLKAGATTGERLRDELIRLTGPSGVSGITGFGPDGDAQRQFSWIQIRNGRFVPAL